ncbi:hypothetical protein UA08_07848 [Talaromyces atroroseus]|uniref:Thioredoxin-like fold domain-containing protein n=1 Tax=Talaromyces atroroseus TaxID=1441469 RepID=A0A225ACT2_TALAT|nr:hypothetical protein UA08_07848 [Talaromyces atroroseus]OKL56713.1 hypothetical protein UA08_07848 [Talaromyces atroroseus]
MSLAPKFQGQKLAAANLHPTPHTLELYLDYVCPFCAKIFNTFYTAVKPIIDEKYSDKLQVIFRQHVQPWHPSSTLVHEAGVAVLKVAPEKFWEFSEALFRRQKEYFDENVVNETRNDTYKRLAALAATVGIDEKKVFDLLFISSEGGERLNRGNGVTNDLKLIIKANRVVGVHVSPTVFFNGIEEKSISSSFTAAQWEEWLGNNVV